MKANCPYCYKELTLKEAIEILNGGNNGQTSKSVFALGNDRLDGFVRMFSELATARSVGT